MKQFNNNEYANSTMEPQYKLAHAYIPFQILGEVYGPTEALCKGTLFPKLYMPYQCNK